MNVLLVSNYSPDIGGISGQIELLLKYLPSDALKVSLFNCKANKLRRVLLPFLLILKARRANVLHLHGCSYLGFYPIVIGVFAGIILRKKIIITYHGGDLENYLKRNLRFARWVLKKADILTVPSKYLKSILDKVNIPSIIIPNILRDDNIIFKKRDKLAPLLTTTRSHEKIYNLSLLISAFAELKKHHKNAKLRLIGDGSLRKQLELLVLQMGLVDVEFVGKVNNSEIGQELNKADIYINPTTKDSFSVSMFEAFACGLPVISTNVGAIPDNLIDGYNGLLIESNNVEQLVEKIEYLLNNIEHANQIVKNAYDTFKKHTWIHLKEKYCVLYLS